MTAHPAAGAVEAVHFLVGMSRCGITPIARCLNSHSQIAVFGESRFWGRQYVKPKNSAGYGDQELAVIRSRLLAFRWRATVGAGPGCLRLSLPELRSLLAEVFAEARPPVRPGELFRTIAERIGAAEGKTLILEKTPNHLAAVHRIVAELPQASFVVLLCDPYVFVRCHRENGVIDHPLAAAILWRGYVRAYERARRKHPERLVVVRLEELAASPQEVLERVQRRLRVPVEDITASLRYPGSQLPSVARHGARGAELFWVNFVAGRIMKRHGYEPVTAPFAPLAVGRSLLTLGPWMVVLVRDYGGKRLRRLPGLLQWIRD
jgi:hypothetical protein